MGQRHHGRFTMRSIKASEFKAECLQIMDEVAATGEPVVITRRGEPVAELTPVRSRRISLVGLHAGRGTITGDVISPFEDEWEAAR